MLQFSTRFFLARGKPGLGGEELDSVQPLLILRHLVRKLEHLRLSQFAIVVTKPNSEALAPSGWSSACPCWQLNQAVPQTFQFGRSGF